VSGDGCTPRWSPKGDRLAYTTSDPNGGEGELWICGFRQGQEGRSQVFGHKQITSERQQIYGLTWTADGQSIVFASKRGGPMQLYEVAVDGGSPLPVLSGVGRYEAPSAAPNSSRLVFSHYRLANDLRIMNLDSDSGADNITLPSTSSISRLACRLQEKK
jgi:Tol biopolymer transport system component